jgi:hypothetical protein
MKNEHANRKKVLLLFLLGLFLTLYPISESFADETQHHTHTFTGKAYDENGELFYVEKHDTTYEGNRLINSLTTYYDPNERVLGTLTSEYDRDPRFCTYTFKDFRAGYEDGAQMEKNRICLFRKPAPQKPKETECLPKTQEQIVGQGFHHFIVNHLEAIDNGEILHVKLVFPSRLDEYTFRIRKLEEKGDRLLVRLEVDNWILRLFAPYVEAVYDRKNGRLLRYEGISNISNAEGDHESVVIDYTY